MQFYDELILINCYYNYVVWVVIPFLFGEIIKLMKFTEASTGTQILWSLISYTFHQIMPYFFLTSHQV